MNDLAAEQYAETYDATVQDWPGEIDFYAQLADDACSESGGAVLELGCGTGRVAIPLAARGIHVVGLDRSPQMLRIARQKSRAHPNVAWVEDDMRTFELGQRFALVLVPAHSFQNLLTAEDQVACLETIRRHLRPGGLLCLHLDHPDMDWLGHLVGDGAGVYEEVRTTTDPETGTRTRTAQAWWYERSTQTAFVSTVWELLGGDGRVVDRVASARTPIHTVFPVEVEHLLRRAHFGVAATYGDFYRSELTDQSSEMIWLAHPMPR